MMLKAKKVLQNQKLLKKTDINNLNANWSQELPHKSKNRKNN
jgi:hypothetical protein